MELLKIKNEPGLAKDSETNAVINTDVRGCNQYLAQRKRMIDNKEKINDYEKQLKNLIFEVQELKNALHNILSIKK